MGKALESCPVGEAGIHTVRGNRRGDSGSLRPERHAAATAGQRVPDDVRPLRVSDQHDLLARTRGNLCGELRRQRGGSGGGGAGVVGERRWVYYDGGADGLRAVVDNGADQ